MIRSRWKWYTADGQPAAGMPDAERALEAATARAGDAQGRLEALRDKVKALGHDQKAVDDARARLRSAEAALDAARLARRSADTTAATAVARADAATIVLEQAEAQHAALGEMAEDARHTGRVAELLQSFRNELVGEVGPKLSHEAADLFAELTDREYDELRVDPDTYEVRIFDHGTEYGMDRFSGSETDLANLALRVAISEHVRFQSGGQVGLLVLDEVFGPLDDDRKERMLLALERLRARFRQVVVVTHDREIKEQLPTAIEVSKLPGRRATAKLLEP
jgi:DNA repair exonuclease SbcCD ATPase subunit